MAAQPLASPPQSWGGDEESPPSLGEIQRRLKPRLPENARSDSGERTPATTAQPLPSPPQSWGGDQKSSSKPFEAAGYYPLSTIHYPLHTEDVIYRHLAGRVSQLLSRKELEYSQALSLLPLLLLLLAVCLCVLRLKRRRRSFGLCFQEALHRGRRKVAGAAVKRENRNAAQNARPLRTEWVPRPAADRVLIDILVSEETDPWTCSDRCPSVQSPTGLGFLPCRPLAALPQRSAEQRLLLAGHTLYLFSRGQAVFAARGDIDTNGSLAWSPPLAILPDSGPGFSVAFFKRWFFFVPGAEHRSRTPVHRAERNNDGSLGPWKRVGEIPVGLGHHALAAGHHSLFLLGGRARRGSVGWVFEIRLDSDGQANLIRRIRPLPVPLCPARCAIIRQQLFVWEGPKATYTGETGNLWSGSVSRSDELSLWHRRTTLPETGGAEALYALHDHLLLIQRGHLYRTHWRPHGPLGSWRRLEGRLPRHRSVLLFSDHLLLAGSELAPSGSRQSTHALLAAQLKV